MSNTLAGVREEGGTPGLRCHQPAFFHRQGGDLVEILFSLLAA